MVLVGYVDNDRGEIMLRGCGIVSLGVSEEGGVYVWEGTV